MAALPRSSCSHLPCSHCFASYACVHFICIISCCCSSSRWKHRSSSRCLRKLQTENACPNRICCVTVTWATAASTRLYRLRLRHHLRWSGCMLTLSEAPSAIVHHLGFCSRTARVAECTTTGIGPGQCCCVAQGTVLHFMGQKHMCGFGCANEGFSYQHTP